MAINKNQDRRGHFALFLIIIGIILLIAGTLLLVFPKKNSTAYGEQLVVDVFDIRANYQGTQTGWFGKLISDKFNMQLNIIAPNVVGGGDTLFETRFAAENLGDLIIFSNTGDTLSRLVEAGLILDMTPYLSGDSDLFYYNSAIRNLNDSISGTAIYAIPTELSTRGYLESSESNDSTYGPFLRYDLYSELGYPQMDTLEDLLPVLKDMQDLYPRTADGEKTYAFSFFSDWDNNMMTAAKQPACFYGYEEYGFLLYRADGTDIQDIMDRDSLYQRILKLYYTANQAGLLDPDSRSQNYSDVFGKYTNGQILYSPWPWLCKSAYNTEEHLLEGKGFMLVPINDMQILSFGCKANGNVETVIAIGAATKDPQRMVDFVSWLYSPEGIYANGAQEDSGAPGPEGLTWENTENGPKLTEFGIAALCGTNTIVPDEWGGNTWENGVSTLNVTTVTLQDIAPNGYSYYYNLWDSYLELTDNPLHAAWSEKMNASTTIEFLESNHMLLVQPGYSFYTPAESQEISTIRSQCKRVITQYSWDMIFAENDEKFYSLQAKMIATVKSLGYEEVVVQDRKNIIAQLNEALGCK